MLAPDLACAHDEHVLDARERRELAVLRARAYAPDGDLQDDPRALARLQLLEDRAHGAQASADEPAATDETSAPAPRRRRLSAILVALVVVTAVISATVATLVAAPAPSAPVRFQTIVQGEGWLTDSSEAVVSCLEDDGWDVTWDDATGTLSFTGDRTGQAAAVRECAAVVRAEYDDRIRELRGVRRYPVEVRIASCLRGQGIDVPEPPSRREFAALYGTPEAWVAYDFVGRLSPEDWARVSGACPPEPD